MEGLREEYPLELLLRVSGMSRSTYYHRLRSLRSGTGHQGTDALIRKVAAVLGRRGVSMNFKTVNHRMRSMGLERRWGVTEGMMIHSDQGVLYRCGEYLKFARSHGIVRSMSGKGSCYDNAVIESHFGNLWLGKLDRIPADRAVEMIDSAVSHFNTKRILLKLGGLTPEEYLREYVREHKCGLKVAKIYNTL